MFQSKYPLKAPLILYRINAKSFNFGAEFGLSYDLSKQFLIEARYNLGLSNLVDDNEFNATLKLHGLFVGIGYMFN